MNTPVPNCFRYYRPTSHTEEPPWHFKKCGWVCKIPQLSLPPGNLFGEYRAIDLIAQSATSITLKAEQINLDDREVALKLLLPDLAGDRRMRSKFKEEVSVAGRLRFPAFTTIYDASFDGAIPFCAREYVHGTDVVQRVREGGPLPLDRAVSVVRQVARALQYASEEGVVHRGFHPSSLMLVESPFDSNWSIKLLDCGANDADPYDHRPARDLHDPAPDDPKQAVGPRAADTRADIHSLGVLLSFALTGEFAYPQPFTTAQEQCCFTLAQNPARTGAGAETPSEVSDLIGRMLSLAPQERPQTLAELLEDLDRVWPARNAESR